MLEDELFTMRSFFSVSVILGTMKFNSFLTIEEQKKKLFSSGKANMYL